MRFGRHNNDAYLNNNIILNIETLILVAVWSNPFVFQGSFKIISTENNFKGLLLFRCECDFIDKMDVINVDFSPYHYRFTHLSCEKSGAHFEENRDDGLEDAFYILKYALKESLRKMLTESKLYLTQIDEVAMSSLYQQIKNDIVSHDQSNIDNNDIGFAVSIDYTPTEDIGRKAAIALLEMNQNNEFLFH